MLSFEMSIFHLCFLLPFFSVFQIDFFILFNLNIIKNVYFFAFLILRIHYWRKIVINVLFLGPGLAIGFFSYVPSNSDSKFSICLNLVNIGQIDQKQFCIEILNRRKIFQTKNLKITRKFLIF